MAIYRTVECAFWTDPDLVAMSPQTKLFALYLFTNPHSHVGGIYYLPMEVAARETGLSARVLDTLWDTLSDRVSGAGFARFDKKTSVVWVRNMLNKQGRGDKNHRAVANHLQSLHKSYLIKEFLSYYPQVARHVSDTLYDTLSDTPSEVGTPDQDQDQEQEQEQNGATGKPEDVPIPAVLDTAAFREARDKWFAQRRHRRLSMRPKYIAGQYEALSAIGEPAAIECINETVRQDYQGLFPDKFKHGGSHARNQYAAGPGQRHRG